MSVVGRNSQFVAVYNLTNSFFELLSISIRDSPWRAPAANRQDLLTVSLNHESRLSLTPPVSQPKLDSLDPSLTSSHHLKADVAPMVFDGR
jgi:hypothetical protein